MKRSLITYSLFIYGLLFLWGLYKRILLSMVPIARRLNREFKIPKLIELTSLECYRKKRFYDAEV